MVRAENLTRWQPLRAAHLAVQPQIRSRRRPAIRNQARNRRRADCRVRAGTSQLAPPPSPEVLEAALDQLGNPHALEAKLAQAITARDAVVDEINALIRSAANTDFNPDAFEADHARLEADYQHRLDTVESLEKQLHELEAKRAAITAFHQHRSENPAISYTPEAWRALVDHATIHPDGTIAIAFNDG